LIIKPVSVVDENSKDTDYPSAKAVYDYGQNIAADTQITATATGSAITINPAEAPFAGMKLFGKTTQNGTPTPTEPKELKSVGDSGSFTVKIQGENVEEQTLTMPYTLRSVGDIKDEVDFNRGVFIPRASKFVLSSNNASITPINHASTHAYRQYNIDVPNLNGFSWKEILCNAMPYNNKVHYGNEFGCNLHTSSLIVLGVPLSWLTPYGYVDGDTSTYLTAFKSYLAEKPMTFIYPLATPIETPLTETELNAYRQLYTNKGNTTILSECEDTEITYYVSKPNAQAIGNIHSQVNKDYFKLQQAIISTGGN
jgi:hypothetical protein